MPAGRIMTDPEKYLKNCYGEKIYDKSMLLLILKKEQVTKKLNNVCFH